jgi:2',3'-cyclic-nucleotide 2'-phosphodiesterase (5'-nucleotidase family)
VIRGLLTALLVLVTATAPATKPAATPARPIRQPDKLVVLSTSDVKGKTSPCGCHIPKGGLSRRASFTDSVRADFGQVLVVDAGFFMPEHDEAPYRDAGRFMFDSMKRLRVDVIGVCEKDLRFGVDFLNENAKRTGLALTCANLVGRATGKPVFAPYRIRQIGTVKVGVFALMTDSLPAGPLATAMKVESPEVAARRVIAAMKQQGATVIVLLSQLGRIDAEDLASQTPGIDVIVHGHFVPQVDQGRTILRTVSVYGGEQGQYLGFTKVSLDAARHMKSAESTTFAMGAEVAEDDSMRTLVRTFEDGLNEKLRALDGGTPAPSDSAKRGS